MEENKEIMDNEIDVVTEAAESEDSGNGVGALALYGLAAMAVGGLAYKYVVHPAADKFKTWRKNRKAAKKDADDENIVDADFREEVEETE